MKELTFAGVLLASTTAIAAPPPNADPSLAPWFHSLRSRSNLSCCDIADCRNYPVRPDGEHYQVFFEDSWHTVPTDVISDRTDNPTGDYVTCINRYETSKADPHILCFFKAPRT